MADPGTVGTLDGVIYTSANAGSARFISGDGAAIQMGEGNDVLTNYGTITGNSGRAINLEGGTDTLNMYTGSSTTGRIDGGAGTDTLNLRLDDRTGNTRIGANSGATAATLASVVNFEALNVAGGRWTLADGASFASGANVAVGSTLLVNGTLTAPLTVAGTLGGSGTIAGSVSVASGGTFSAGNSPGILGTGALTLASGANFVEEIGGTTAGSTGYDQTVVTGTVMLNGANLNLSLVNGFTPGLGQSFTIINNDGTADAVTGTFAGLAEGATIIVGGTTFTISYQGGDGNDVTLRTPPPPVGGDPAPPGPTAGDDNLAGTAGADQVSLGLGNDSYSGGAGADLAYGNQGADLIYGNQDADTVYGGQGDDRAYGGMGADVVFGNLGNDVLYGNMGADIVYGNQGADVVYGNQGNDVLYGGMGNDVLYGGLGDDILMGGVGSNVLVGGLGADLYRFTANGAQDLILGFKQGDGDRISLGGQSYTTGTAQNGDALLTLSGGGTIDLAGIRADQVNASYFAA